MSQPLSHLPAVLERMAEAATKATDESCRLATEAVKVVVITQGSRFHIKGRGGRGKFPLVASSDVKRFGKGGGVARGAVFGIPGGFWKIVEVGAKPHTISARRKGRGKRAGRRVLAAPGLGSHPQGSGFAMSVHHPGTHGPIGHPWVAAMSEASRIVPETVAATSTKAFVAAFL